MRFLALALLLAVPAPLWAQTNSVDSDFEALKTNLKAIHFDSGRELKDKGRSLVGKTIEVRGTLNGIISHEDTVSLIFNLPDGQNQLIDSPLSFQSSPALHVGHSSRLLCKVEGESDGDLMLQLLAVTSQLNSNPDGQNDFADGPIGPLVVKNTATISPETSTDAILIGPEVDLPQPPAAPFARGNALGSRSLPAPRSQSIPVAPTQAAASTQRSLYTSLALRNNPRLSYQNADSIAACIMEAAAAQNLDPRFLAAIVQVESQFNPAAVSGAGAQGLGQLMPFNLRPLGVQNPFDVRQNLHGAAKLLRRNLDTYANDPNGTMLAVAAYHAGVGAVNRAGKAIPKATTYRYVWKVYYAYRALAPELFR